MDGKAFCIEDVPVKDIEVVLVKHSQQIEDCFDRKKFAACVQHKASVRVEIGLHLMQLRQNRALTNWGSSVRACCCVTYSQGGRDRAEHILAAQLPAVGKW
jgi:hypothetical protein